MLLLVFLIFVMRMVGLFGSPGEGVITRGGDENKEKEKEDKGNNPPSLMVPPFFPAAARRGGGETIHPLGILAPKRVSPAGSILAFSFGAFEGGLGGEAGELGALA